MHRDHAELCLLNKIERTELRLAQPRCISQEASNTGCKSPGELEMTCSTSDGGRLLLERLGEVSRALPQFVEQSRVLDGDDGLGGEVV